MTLVLGQILPGQEIKINLITAEHAELVGSAYKFRLPSYFFPQYKHHIMGKASTGDDEGEHVYTFKFSMTILAPPN